MEGLRVEGEADRGPCRLAFDPVLSTHVITASDIDVCRAETEHALALYLKAHALGARGWEVDRTIERARERVAKLEAMVRTVRRMELERDAEAPSGL